MKAEETRRLLFRYRDRGLLLDTNVLMPYWVFLWNEGVFRKHKRLQEARDLSLDRVVGWMVDHVKRIVVTPHVLTEMLDILDDERFFRWVASRLGGTRESSRRAVEIATTSGTSLVFGRLGLADATIFGLAHRYLAVTTDRQLSSAIVAAGHECLNLGVVAPILVEEMIGTWQAPQSGGLQPSNDYPRARLSR